MPRDRETPGATERLNVRTTPAELERIHEAMARIVERTGVQISLSAFIRSAVFARVEQELKPHE